MRNIKRRLLSYVSIFFVLQIVLLSYFLSETMQARLHLPAHYYLLFSLLFTFVFIAMLLYYAVNYMYSPLRELSRLLKDLNKGHHWRRVLDQEYSGIIGELIHQTNQLAVYLQQSTEHKNIHADRLQAVIRHMSSGLLFIDARGKIVITNDTLLSTLGWGDDVHHDIYYETPLPEELQQCIRDAFATEKEVSTHMSLTVGSEHKQLDVLAAPVKDLDQAVTGIVLVLHDITDLKQLEQTRKDFVANVSHELKTPVTSIKGFSETLLDGALHSEEHLQEFLGIIRKEADRIHRLIQDLLDLSQIEQKQLSLYWDEVHLNEIIRESIVLIQPEAEQKQIDIQFEAQAYANIEGDADRLRQIFLNLLSNAIQYTPEGGKVSIQVSAWHDDEQVPGYKVSVTDTGIGMAKEDLARIFERFYRVDRARSRASGGTGLGLAIVKHLVDAHYGKLEVSSTEGVGSTFSVYLYAQNPLDALDHVHQED